MCEPLNKESKLNFSEEWLTDLRFKFWISKVESDKSLFHCRLCNKNFTCGWSHIVRHANSNSHKQNEGTVIQKKSLKRKFQQQWLDLDIFKPWLREVPHNKYLFSCTFCNIISVGDLSNIYGHANSKSHEEICKKNDSENNNKTDKDEPVLSFDEREKIAEIQYAAFMAEKNISPEMAEEILTFFQEIGKDANVLQSMSMGSD